MGQCGEPVWFMKTMPVHLSKQQIARYCERQVSPEELIQMDDHLSECPACRAQLASSFDMRAASVSATLPRLAGSSAVSGSPRGSVLSGHVTYEQLEAFLDGKATAVENETLRAHVDSCRVCADELRDLSDFKAALASSIKKHPIAKEKWWTGFAALRLTPPRLAVVLVTSALLVLAVVVERMPLSLVRTRSSPSAGARSSNVAGPNPDGDNYSTSGQSSLKAAIDGLTPEERVAVLKVYSDQVFLSPEALAQLRERQHTLMGESEPSRRFGVLAPLGEVVLDTSPIFRWQSVAGATAYVVAIFDADFNPVQSSPPVRGTQWTPNRPLKRGQIYKWQVTATLSDGNTVQLPRPPSPEARFLILDQKKADELAQFQKTHPESHVVLGILYVQAGLLDQGQQELLQISQNDPDHNLAQNLLKSINDIRRLQH